MFTGIIQEIGQVRRTEHSGKILRYWVEVSDDMAQARDGASIAIDGVCQTVTGRDRGALTFEAINETLSKTTLGALRQGSKVHLEPALRLSDRLDGHLVYGHVDLKGRVEKTRRDPGRWDLTVGFPQEHSRYVVQGGSICINGVSLTVFGESKGNLSVSLIPETLDRTLFQHLQPGKEVNLEFDAMAKFAEKMTLSSSDPTLRERLGRWGYS